MVAIPPRTPMLTESATSDDIAMPPPHDGAGCRTRLLPGLAGDGVADNIVGLGRLDVTHRSGCVNELTRICQREIEMSPFLHEFTRDATRRGRHLPSPRGPTSPRPRRPAEAVRRRQNPRRHNRSRGLQPAWGPRRPV